MDPPGPYFHKSTDLRAIIIIQTGDFNCVVFHIIGWFNFSKANFRSLAGSIRFILLARTIADLAEALQYCRKLMSN